MRQQVRVWFARTGSALPLSQLNLRKSIRQAFFRSRLPFCNTVLGKSALHFIAPLAVGVESNTECFDFEMPDAFFDPDAIFGALNGVMPAGLQVFAVTPVRHSAAEITAVRYLLCLRAGAKGCATAEQLLRQTGALPREVTPGPLCSTTMYYQWIFQNMRSRMACLDLTVPRSHPAGFDPRKLFAAPGGGKAPVNLLSVCRTQFLLPDGTVFE